jgi:hypothetical protein
VSVVVDVSVDGDGDGDEASGTAWSASRRPEQAHVNDDAHVDVKLGERP